MSPKNVSKKSIIVAFCLIISLCYAAYYVFYRTYAKQFVCGAYTITYTIRSYDNLIKKCTVCSNFNNVIKCGNPPIPVCGFFVAPLLRDVQAGRCKNTL